MYDNSCFYEIFVAFHTQLGNQLEIELEKDCASNHFHFRVDLNVPKFLWFLKFIETFKNFKFYSAYKQRIHFFDQIFWNIKKYNQDQAGRAGVAYPSYYSPTTAGTSSPNGTSTVGPTANQLTPPSASAMSHTTGQIDTQAGNHYHASYTQYWANQVSKLNMIEVREQSWKMGFLEIN